MLLRILKLDKNNKLISSLFFLALVLLMPSSVLAQSDLLRMGQGTLEIFHFENREIPYPLKEAVAQAEGTGMEIRGHILTEAQFEAAQRELLDVIDVDELRSRLQMESEREKLSRNAILDRLDRLKKEIFGFPGGLTFRAHFQGPSTIGADQRNAIIEGMILANPIFLVSLLSQGESVTLPLLFLNAWIFTYIKNIKKISSFRGQNRLVELDPSAPLGGQIQVSPSTAFVGTVTFFEQLVFNSIMMTAIFGTLDGPMLLNILSNAALSTFAKAHFETKITRLFEESKSALRNGDFETHEELSKQAIRIERWVSNRMIPALKLTHLLVASYDFSGHAVLGKMVQHLFEIGLVGMGLPLLKKPAQKLKKVLNPFAGSLSPCQQLFAL